MASSQSSRTEHDPEPIKLLLTLGVIFLLWIKYIWDKLEENDDEFYPDGLNRCPPDTYPLDNGERVKCFSCPRCPSGMEPTPSCGTTLAVKLKGECVPCRTGTYSNYANSDACKTCTDCGSRDTLISCNTERDAECKECPWFHFEDPMTNTCKHCDFCCGRNSSARLKCITSKMCNVTCTHTRSIRRKFPYNILKRKLAKANNSSGKIPGPISQSKERNRPVRSVQKDDDRVTKSESENGEHQMDSKSNRYADLEDIEDIQLSNLVIPDTILQDQTNYFLLARDNVKKTSAANLPNERATDQRNELSISTAIKPIMALQFPTGKENQLLGTALPTQRPIQVTLAPTPPSTHQSPHLISLPLFLSSLMGTLTACAFLGLVILVACIVRTCIHKRCGNYKRLLSDQPDIEGEGITSTQSYVESFYESFCGQHKARMSPKDPEHPQIAVNSDCNLAYLPLDLQEILKKKLDVRCGRQRSYGWKKVGEAFQIPTDDLKYLKLEYKRETGSPTLRLLEILGMNKTKTISDLVTVLEGPELRRPDISSIIILT